MQERKSKLLKACLRSNFEFKSYKDKGLGISLGLLFLGILLIEDKGIADFCDGVLVVRTCGETNYFQRRQKALIQRVAFDSV